MLNKKGMTLIESLFSFAIYITIIILYVSLINTLFLSLKKVDQTRKNFQSIENQLGKEEIILEIDKVLHL